MKFSFFKYISPFLLIRLLSKLLLEKIYAQAVFRTFYVNKKPLRYKIFKTKKYNKETLKKSFQL